MQKRTGSLCIDPRLRKTTFDYYSSGVADGLLRQTIAHNADSTTIVYDGHGHPDTITRADGSVVDVSYHARGDLLSSQITTAGDPNPHAVTMTYDKRRLLLTVRDSLNFGVTHQKGQVVSASIRACAKRRLAITRAARPTACSGRRSPTTRTPPRSFTMAMVIQTRSPGVSHS
jgi:hypothetical protein